MLNDTLRKTAVILMLAFGGLPALTASAAQVIYVDAQAAGQNNGNNWINAYVFLQDALTAAQDGDAVWVASGVYRPDRGAGYSPAERTATFRLKNGVGLYGGFPVGGDWHDRDPKRHVTILSGDLLDDDGPNFSCYDDNSYNVVTGSYTDDSAVLDGFTIRGGSAMGSYPYNTGGGMICDHGRPLLVDCVFTENQAGFYGGGFFNRYYPVTLIRCEFVGNRSLLGGGGAMNWGGNTNELIDCRFLGNRSGCGGGYQEYFGSSTLVNCLFSGNQAVSCSYGGGGAVLANYGDIHLINCTLVGNTCLGTDITGRGAGIYINNGSAQVTNCLIWDNRDEGGIDASAQIDVGSGSANVQYSCVLGWSGIETNIGEDPRLVDATGADQIYGTLDDNCRLGPASSCLDAGDSTAVPAAVTTDLDGQSRFQNGLVDIGAFEGIDQDICPSTDRLTIPEGTSRSFVVMLARDPGGTVPVHVAVTAGDPDIQITSTDTLVFDSLNYYIGQGVTVTALADEDALQNTAIIQLTADGFRPAGLTVHEQESLPASVLYVDQSAAGANSGADWADAFTDLQDAIACARTHAEITAIFVAQGVYRPAGSPAGRSDTFELLPGVSLLGGFPAGGGGLEQRRPDEYVTILSGDLLDNDLPVTAAEELFDEPTRRDNSLHVVSGLLSDEDSILDGFTIRGANSNLEYSMYNDGGGLHLDSGCRATIRQCLFEDNSSYCGGGLCGSAVLTGCTFRRNAAAWAGGGAALVESMHDCLVELNYSDGRGGGIYIQAQDSTFTDCLIRQNTAGQEGGGICLDVSTQRPRVVGCRLIRNQADQGGGAASIGCTCGADPVYVNCRFLGNSAVEGGGLYSEGEINNTLNGCVFVGNSAEEDGGAICDGPYSASDLFNCTIGYNDAAKGAGGGIYAKDEDESHIYNSICWGNTAKDAPDGGATAQIDGARSTVYYFYSCIEGWIGGENGNHGLNPRFLDADGPDNLYGTEDDNVRLAPDSPCIDTASNELIGEDLADLDHDGQTAEPIPFDLDGRDRIDNGVVDMGAYETLSAVQYDIVDLGTLGGEYSVAWSINNQGQIIGWSQRADGQYHAARFDFQDPQNNADLGTLGGNWSEAVSINSQGYGVGQARTGQTGYVYHAALFAPAGSGDNVDLGGLGGDAGWAYSINDSNQIVGTATLADGSWRATRFDAGGSGDNVNLGILDTPWGSDDSCALSINNLGQIVGYGRFSFEGTNIERAVRFDPSGGGANINLTPGTDGGRARCINDAGQIVGSSRACQGACRFDPSGGGANLALGGLTAGLGSTAHAINNHGQIVGIAGRLDPQGEPVDRAVLFDTSGQGDNIDLNRLIPPDLGWVLKAAYDINENGWIVGYGQNPQGISHRAFLLIPRNGSADPIAHWKLDESEGTAAFDSAGSHHGNLVNGPVWQPQIGALAFDGDDDYVDCGSHPDFDLTGAISVAAWVNIRQVDKDWQAVVTKGDSAWRLSTVEQTRRFHFAVTGAPYQYVSGSIEVPPGQWHHVCGTYDGASIRLYIDGVEDPAGPVAYAGGITTNSYPVYIGENAEATGRHWNGSLDDVRVYNYALTPGEVAELASRPTVYYVDAAAAAGGDGYSWSTAYRHLQDALAAAHRGDRIHVAQGTYRPDRDADHPDGGGGRDVSFQLVNGAALYGGFPTGGGTWAQRDPNTHATILSGDLGGNDTGPIDDPSRDENCYHVVRASYTDAATILDGFVISGGNAADGTASGPNCRGGGMYNEYADPRVIRCTFTRNSCGDNSGLGGGGLCNQYSHPSIVQCTFIDNHYIGADDDGGGGLCNFHSHPVLRDCEFIANTSGGSGGGMLNTQSTPHLTNCIFRDNRSSHNGGGMCNRISHPVLRRCRFLQNRAVYSGGGVSNEFQSRPTLLDCVISGNAATNDYSAGGGIYNNYQDAPLLVRCLLTGNTARQGGGLYSYYGTVTLRNCTLHGNRADDQGPSIYLRATDATLTDSIVWGDHPPAAGAIYAAYYLEAKTLAIRYCDIQAGPAGVTIEAGNILGWGPGNIEADPLFVKSGYWQEPARTDAVEEAAWFDGDYHLQSQGWRWNDREQTWTFDRFSSRCIDAGNPGAPTAAEPLTLPVDPDNLWGVNRRLNLGTYGGTVQASMPPHGWSLLADLTNDGTVDLADYACQVADWLTTEPALPGDLDRDGTVSGPDLELLGLDWLKHTVWYAQEP